MDKDIDIWKQRNEILHKKVDRQMDEIKDLQKKGETIFDLARRFPDKTYRELEKYRDADRQEEADSIPLTDTQKGLVQTVEEAINKNKGVCVTGALKRDLLQEELDRVKEENNDLFLRIAELTEIEESHRKMNGKLQERLTEVEEDNKKIAKQVEDQVERVRKAGL